MKLTDKEIRSLEEFLGIDNITVKGSLGFKDSYDFILFPSKNIKAGDLYIVNDSGLYQVEEYKASEVNLLEGDIVVCKDTKEFALPTNDNWIRITRLKQNNFFIRCFVSYPIKQFMDDDSNRDSIKSFNFEVYEEKIKAELLKSYLLVNNTCTVTFTNGEFNFPDEILQYKNNPVDFTVNRLKKLRESDYICFYKGWNEDPMCRYEYEIAKLLNKNIIIYNENNL